MLLALLFAVGCGPREWTGHEQCPAETDAAKRDACWVATLPKLFCTAPADAEALTQKEISSQENRDYVWLQVTEKVAPETAKYCERIVNPELKKMCVETAQRPHLHCYTTEAFCPNAPRKCEQGGTPGRGPNRGGAPIPGGPGGPPPPGSLPGAPPPGNPPGAPPLPQ